MSEGRRALSPVVPHTAARRRFVPQAGGFLVVDIPGETVRVEVREVVTVDIVIGKIVSNVIGKGGSTFRKDDPIACKRVMGQMGEYWAPISNRDVEMQEQADRAADAERDRQAQAAAAAAERRETPADFDPPAGKIPSRSNSSPRSHQLKSPQRRVPSGHSRDSGDLTDG